MNKGLWAVSLFLIVLGLACVAAALAYNAYRKDRELLSAHVTAKVVDIVSMEDNHPGDNYRFSHRFHPVFEYYANGKLYKEIYPQGSMPGRWHTGEEVKLRYNPRDPSDYEIDSGERKENLPLMLEAAGIFFIVLGALLFISFASRN